MTGPSPATGGRAVDPAPRRYAMTRWEVWSTYVQLVVADASLLEDARAATVEILAEVDATCSRFRQDSDLSRVNRAAGRRVPVSPLFVDALLVALEAAEQTGGLVDPALGLRLASLGYDADIEVVRGRAASTCDPAAPAPGPGPGLGAWRQVEVDPEGAVRVPEGTALDLGSVGKAFAADLVATHVPRLLGTDLLISLGGDVAIGYGHDGPRDTEWPVAVGEDPDAPPQQVVHLSDGGLATSSTLRRRWRRDGRAVHHVVDPRTGTSAAEVWRTVSVAAPSCVQANTATTASLVLGEEAPAWLEERFWPSRLVRADGTTTYLNRWPRPE